jgi:hypothetical protein
VRKKQRKKDEDALKGGTNMWQKKGGHIFLEGLVTRAAPTFVQSKREDQDAEKKTEKKVCDLLPAGHRDSPSSG